MCSAFPSDPSESHAEQQRMGDCHHAQMGAGCSRDREASSEQERQEEGVQRLHHLSNIVLQ